MAFSIDLSGKTVIITGVSSGIGAGIAKAYAKANANIAGCALEPSDHKNIQEFIAGVEQECGRKPFYMQVDVTQVHELQRFVNKVVEHCGGIDILASNAGANVFRGAEDCTPEEWDFNINLNLKSHWNLARLAKPYLEKNRHGVIIITSSTHSINTMPGCFPYNIAKMGLKSMVQALTMEWSPNIRVLGVAPGYTYTSMIKEYFETFPDPVAKLAEVEQLHPLNRIGTPDEIGAWFVFLSSDYAAFAGGQTYAIDGGRSAVMM